jgi:hypothetical protein
MPTSNPQQKRSELISTRKKQLLALGYMPGIVEKAMVWAEGCADGMVEYAHRQNLGDDNPVNATELANQFLPQYLADSERWIQSFGHKPGEVKAQRK